MSPEDGQEGEQVPRGPKHCQQEAPGVSQFPGDYHSQESGGCAKAGAGGEAAVAAEPQGDGAVRTEDHPIL